MMDDPVGKPPDDAEATLDSTPSSAAVAQTAPARSIGPYRLIRKLGQGGMGQVWLAEQTAPFHRQVALKLIKAGLFDDSLLQRFQAERQSLAIMNHPSIAKVFDAGATSEGQPYFVMEYVAGLPITDYCDQNKMNIGERLSLFIKVCEGVQHAHQKAIMHRDLKPANILVVDVDGKPTPRIIDFGIAKAVSPQGPAESFFTQFAGGFVGTPGYMSPEQADPTVQDVDTRTDVYSLGVVLYVLLTGLLPFDPTLWKEKPLPEVLRQLREEDPPRPSAKIDSSRDTQETTAKLRQTEPQQLVSLLSGDLDWITLKAMEKDRDRRYATPSELAADIQRYLQNQPIVARPASTFYRVRKYVRRHRVGVGVASGLAAVLIAFAVTQAIELRRITRERDRADRVAQFMTDMFRVSNPSESRGNTVTAREILDKASKNINTGLAKDPELQASMMDLMGRVYNHLGLHVRAQELLVPALEIRRRVLGTKDPDTLFSMVNLGVALDEQGKLPDAIKLYREVMDLARKAGRAAHRPLIAAMNNLALDLQDEGQIADAEKMQRDILDIERKELGPEHADTLTAASNLALTLQSERHFADAEKLNRQVLEARRRTLGLDHPDTLRSAANLAYVLEEEQGHDAEAEQLLLSTLDVQRRVVGPEHPDTLVSMNLLGVVYEQENKLGESETLKVQLLEIARRTLGPEHPRTLNFMNNVAAVLEEEGKYPEAVRQFRDLLEIRRRLNGPEDYSTLLVMTNLAAALQNSKQFPEAEKLGRQALEIERRKLGNESPLTLGQMTNLAFTLQQLKRGSEAQALLLEAREHQAKVYGADNPQTAHSTYVLGAWAALHGDRDKAFDLLRQAVDHGLDVAMLQNIEKDPDLKSLHGDPRFTVLVAAARERATAAQKTH